MKHTKQASGGSARAVLRSLDILLTFLQEGRELGVSDVARALHLPKATAHRLMTALAGRGFLARHPQTAQYTVGLSAFRLGTLFLAQTGLREAAVPVIRELARTTGETVNLNVVVDRRRVCIEKAESTQDIRHFVELGRPTPLHAGASGRLLLAYLDPEEVEAVIAEGLPPMGPRTVTDAARLRRGLAEIRRRGYAVSQDERVAGAAAVSAPVCDGTGRVVAGLTISGPSYRFPAHRVRRYVGLVRDAAARISAALGHVPPVSPDRHLRHPTAPARRRAAAR